MKNNVYILNAFSITKEGGNPAGVVINADNLTEENMLYIAKKVNLSETAFVSSSDIADFKVRFFTPTNEVDLCGHATIATFALLFKNKIISEGKYTQETKAGVLDVFVNDKGIITMQQNKPMFFEKFDLPSPEFSEVCDSIGLGLEDIGTEDLEFNIFNEIQVVSTGLKDVIVPVKSKEILLNIEPKFDKIEEISNRYSTSGYHIFAKEDNNIYCRNFAPADGIPEEAATGSASGSTACYLIENKIIKSDKITSIIFTQGESMNRPSTIYADIFTKEGIIENVHIGGEAILLDSLEVSFEA